MQNIYPFPVPVPQTEDQNKPGLIIACAYPSERFAHCSDDFPEGIIADYSISAESATIQAASTNAEMLYIYNGEYLDEFHLQSNQLQLLNAFTDGPQVQQDELSTQLLMQMEFPLQFSTHASAAQLGVVHLVQSQRSLQLQNGEHITLLESKEPVLYLDQNNHRDGIELITEQDERRQSDYHYRLSLHQAIPEIINGIALESLTVLEQYQSYFMQRPLLNNTSVIWTPLLAPISWGWSIRIGRRADGAWTIVRRKLVLPSVSHDGLLLPLWQSNTRLSALNDAPH